MYLNRQIVPCIDQFGQDRKIGEFGAIFSQNGLSFRFQIFPQGFPRIGAILNDAGAVRMAGQYPRLRKNLSLTGNSIFRLQSVPTPEVVLAGRFQLHQPHFSLLLLRFQMISCASEISLSQFTTYRLERKQETPRIPMKNRLCITNTRRAVSPPACCPDAAPNKAPDGRNG